MKFTPQQDAALLAAERWRRDPAGQPFFSLDGPAGTGKTTLAKTLAEGANNPKFIGPTGKSAAVLRSMGCVGAQTGHQLIYCPASKSREHLRKLEKYLEQLRKMPDSVVVRRDIEQTQENIQLEADNLKRPAFSLNLESTLYDADLLIVDEKSMFDKQYGEDLVSFGVPILALGDPFQLPPVFGTGYFTAREADFTLTEVHRQALDSPVLWMATEVREGRPLRPGAYGESRVCRSGEVTPEEVLEAEQILVGHNATRRASNNRVRSLKGLEGYFPKAGERLVCLRNNHDLGIMNGGVYLADDDAQDDGAFINLMVRPEEGGDSIFVGTHREHYLGRSKEIDTWSRRDAEEFDFSYALTVHKSQGSEFKSTVFFDEWRGDHRLRWLYTGITRARERMTLVQA